MDSQVHTSSVQPLLKEFNYTTERKGKVYATLSLLGHEDYSKEIPTIVEGSPLGGRIHLNLDRPDQISSIILIVSSHVPKIQGYFGIGGTTYTSHDLWFLDISSTIWSQSEGEPHPSSVHSSASRPTTAARFKGSLLGEYTWPFSVDIPKEVNIPLKPNSEPLPFRLPQTFSDRYIRATIRYTATVKITRSGLFKVDDKIFSTFGYVMNSRPAMPVSPLRQAAYEEGIPLLGPTVDPNGWYSQAPIFLHGTLFKTTPVHLDCMLYLAQPLSYTKGSAIPLSLCLRSENELLLDILSTSSKAIHLRLRRRIQSHIHQDNAFEDPSFRDALDYSQRAIWWSSRSHGNSGKVRFISGELHLKTGMSPSSELAKFKITYSVMLYDFEAPGLELPSSKFLQEIPVEICNFYGPGPHPKSTTPHDTKPDVEFGVAFVPDTQEFSKGFF